MCELLTHPNIDRDLSPDNIMISKLDNNYILKLTDFGLSVYHNYVHQSHSKYVGKKSYRAPELNFGSYNTKSEIYSLGVIMQELFNFDVNSEQNEVDVRIQLKYENARAVCLMCLQTPSIQRPNCMQIMLDKDKWYYELTVDETDTAMISEVSQSSFRVYADKWNFPLENHGLDIIHKSRLMSVIEKRAEKSIIITKESKIYAISLSNNNGTKLLIPNQITQLASEQIKLITKGRQHVLLLSFTHKVYSFGCNNFGQLGHSSGFINNIPSNIECLNDKVVMKIICSDNHALALTKDGKLFSWGDGSYGQNGNGLNDTQYTPQEVDFFKDKSIAEISCGLNHCIVLSENGEVFGWGSNECGQLGIGTFNDKNIPRKCQYFPKDVIEVSKLCCGDRHSLLLARNDDIYFCGSFMNKARIFVYKKYFCGLL